MVCGGEGIPPTAELCVFICAVNMGVGSTGFLTCLSRIHEAHSFMIMSKMRPVPTRRQALCQAIMSKTGRALSSWSFYSGSKTED